MSHLTEKKNLPEAVALLQTGKSDEELLALSISKPSIFELLMGRYEDSFRNKVRSIVGMREEVDDILQETFVKIYLNANRFHKVPGASFKSWAYKILLNTTFTHYQKFKKDDGALVRPEKEFYESLPGKPIDFETPDFVASILTRMPKMLQNALKLHFLFGMPQKEIAAIENVSISAIKTRIHRAKKEFKKISSELSSNSR